ncbi:MAG: cytochrome P450, partial [Pseudomonadota bacterium]
MADRMMDSRTSEPAVSGGSGRALAPGPRGIGAIRILGDFGRDAAGTLADLSQRYGDVSQFRVLGRLNTLVRHPEDIRTVLIDHGADTRKGAVYDAYRPVIGDGLLTSDGETWAVSRAIAQPSFRGTQLRAFATLTANRAESAVEQWSRQPGRIDLAEAFRTLTFDIVASALFSSRLTETDRAEMFESLDAANEAGTSRIRSPLKLPLGWPSPGNRAYRRVVARLDAIIGRLIEERRAQGPAGGDYLDALLEADAAGRIAARMVRDQVVTFLFAGHETTSNALSWTCHLVSLHPQWAVRIAAEAAEHGSERAENPGDPETLPIAAAVFREAMRLYPPIYAIQRRADRALRIRDWEVPAGTGITVSPYATHRHPDFWPEPERFRPERFLDPAEAEGRPRMAYIPFGAGPRTCIGANFAMVEGVIVLSRLLEKLTLAPEPGHEVRTVSLISLAPAGGLPL